MAAARTSLQRLRQIVQHRTTEMKGFERVLKGIKVVDGGDGKCVCEMKVTDQIQNALGTLHGGYIAHLVDSVSTWSLMSCGSGEPGVTVNINISYLKGVKVGEDIIIESNILRLGRNIAFLEVELRNKEGHLVAQGSHTKFIGETSPRLTKENASETNT